MDELILGSSACAPSSSLSLFSSHPFDNFMDSHYGDSAASDDLIKCTDQLSLSVLPACPEVPRVARQHLIIWDWDDTIFPTFSFRTHQDGEKQFLPKLRTLVLFTEEVFEAMIARYGAESVVIVTNASASWVHNCVRAELIAPIYAHFRTLLEKHDIDIISASTPRPWESR